MATKKKSIKGTRTEQYVVNSYMAETQAYARYTFYAGVADKEKYFPVGVIFRESADNELHHAKVFLKMLEDTEVECTGNVDAGFLGNTAANLRTAIKEESVDGYEFYHEAANVAKEEGFDEIASHFEAIAQVEKMHHDRFQLMLKHVEEGTLWKRTTPVTWRCLVCGYTETGTEPPKVCPGCDHPYQHYIALEDGYAPAPEG